MRLPLVGLSLLSKSFVEVRGRDATKFLNGLVTSRFLPSIEKKKQYTISDADSVHSDLNEIIDIQKNWGLMHEDIYDPEHTIHIGRDGINSMFLNSKGRVITDCFIYANPFHTKTIDEETNYLIEIDSGMKSQLLMMLKLHKLSSKIKIKSVDYSSYYYYNDSINFDQYLDHLHMNFFKSINPTMAMENAGSIINQNIIFHENLNNSVLGFAIDNRIPNFGIKFITNKPIDTNKSVFSNDFPFESSILPEENITQRRFVNGLFEMNDAPKDMSLLPFDTNLDYTNGLSLEKGCYMGQELTIRTYNNGIIRKRILPVQFFNIDELPIMEQSEALELNQQSSIIEDLKHITSFENVAVSHLAEQEEAEPTQKLASSPFGSISEKVPSPKSEETAPSPFGTSSSPFGSSKPVRRRKTSPGKIISIQDNLGFVLINLSDVKTNKFYKIDVTLPNGMTREFGVKVEIPDWWPEDEE